MAGLTLDFCPLKNSRQGYPARVDILCSVWLSEMSSRDKEGRGTHPASGNCVLTNPQVTSTGNWHPVHILTPSEYQIAVSD